MDDAIDLAEYLPVSFKTPSEQEYLPFLWQAFEQSYNSGTYHFAFLAYHMLMMSFVYFKIWQIREICPNKFAKESIGLNLKKNLLAATSPFSFSEVNERSILQLFMLIGCDESNIGSYKSLVDDRNEAAHVNGNIYFKTQPEIDAKIYNVLRAVGEIQTHSHPLIQHYYERFLIDSYDPDEREYMIAEDQIRETLIHDSYMSRKDIELCANFDISVTPHENREAIEDLHNTLCEIYPTALED